MTPGHINLHSADWHAGEEGFLSKQKTPAKAKVNAALFQSLNHPVVLTSQTPSLQ